ARQIAGGRGGGGRGFGGRRAGCRGRRERGRRRGSGARALATAGQGDDGDERRYDPDPHGCPSTWPASWGMCVAKASTNGQVGRSHGTPVADRSNDRRK